MKILAYHFLPFWNVTNAKCGASYSATQNAKYNGVKIWKGPKSWCHRWTCESMPQLCIPLSPNVDQISMPQYCLLDFEGVTMKTTDRNPALMCLIF